jgi:DnaJ-class molecular chaperone
MKETHYDVLGLDKDSCELKDIKKAYRKLALKYHPDRVAHDKVEESTIKFREVSEAYQVLSDETKKAEYDRSLRFGTAGENANTGHSRYSSPHFYHQARDPFSQFNDLFRNDPFFSESMKDMDDLFSKTFQNQNRNQAPNKKQGWGEWVMDSLGVQVQMTSTSRSADGTFSTSSYGRSSNARSSGTYTSKKTRTIIENGRRITIQSMEKDGNRIEERYEGNNLVQRLINGRPQDIGRIAGGDRNDL